jgi:hypothetical protein
VIFQLIFPKALLKAAMPESDNALLHLLKSEKLAQWLQVFGFIGHSQIPGNNSQTPDSR